MGIDWSRGREAKKKFDRSSGSRYVKDWYFPDGQTLFMIPEPIEGMGDYDIQIGVPIVRHFGVHPAIRYPVLSLSHAAENEGVWDERTQAHLAEINEARVSAGKPAQYVDRSGDTPCPISDVLDGSDPDLADITSRYSDEQRGRMRGSLAYVTPIIPLATRRSDDDEWAFLPEEEAVPRLSEITGRLAWDIFGQLSELARRQRTPTDPSAPVFVTVTRSTASNRTTYKAGFDLDSYEGFMPGNPDKRATDALPRGLADKIRSACKPGGTADPFAAIARKIKSRESLIDLMRYGGDKKEELTETDVERKDRQTERSRPAREVADTVARRPLVHKDAEALLAPLDEDDIPDFDTPMAKDDEPEDEVARLKRQLAEAQAAAKAAADAKAEAAEPESKPEPTVSEKKSRVAMLRRSMSGGSRKVEV